MTQTLTDLARGRGKYERDRDPDRLDAWPAQELYRLIETGKQRDWPSRWAAAGGEFFAGRMIALKGDPVWQALGDGTGGYEDTLGLPYPPFAFNSGMWVGDISRAEAVDLGLMQPDDVVEPAPDRGWGEALQVGVKSFSEALQQSLLETTPGARIEDGVLHLAANSFYGHSGRKGFVGGSAPRDEAPDPNAPETKANLQKGRNSMWQIMADHKDVLSAMSRSGIGDIDFIWKRGDAGISHILSRREDQDRNRPLMNKFSPEETAIKVVDVIALGAITYRSERKIILKHEGFVAALAPSDRHGNAWIISGREDSGGGRGR